MATSELVRIYETARRRAARLGRWRLQWWAWRVRRARRNDTANEAHQVRLVAIEHELVVRGVLICPTFPSRAPPSRPRSRRRRWWRRR